MRCLGLLILCQLLYSCSSPAPTIIHEAADYTPIGDALGMIGLCALGISIVVSVAGIIKTNIKSNR